MSCRPLVAGGRRWRFCPDDAPTALQRVQAVVDLAVADELSGASPTTPLAIMTSRAGLTPRVGPDGRLGLVGRPAEFLPPAQVPGTVIPVEVTAPRHLRHTLDVTLQAPPQPTVRVALHPKPVAVWGRVLDTSGAAPVPVAGATVQVVGVKLLALAQGLYAARAAGGPAAARVRRRELAPTGPGHTLVGGVGAGAVQLRLSSRQGLTFPPNPASPDILLIGLGDPERLEALRVTTVEGAIAADEPATVGLAHPLRRAHPTGTPVRRAAPQPPGPDVALSQAAVAGDVTLLVADASSFPLVNFIELESAGDVPAPEHQALRPLAVTTDADGRFRLPALHRLSTLALEITASALTVQHTVDLDSATSVQLVELPLP